MNYKKLIKDWKPEECYRFDTNLLSSKGLNENTVDFLSIIGLPISAAPFLDFAHIKEYRELQSIYMNYNTGEFEHKQLLSVGADGAGDPICIDLKNDCRIVALNHEEGFKPSFMNSSVMELFQFLTIYKAFVKEVILTNGEDAFLDSNFTDEQYEDLKNTMEELDRKALVRDAFWTQELELLLDNREYFLNQK
jgi:hypothetical protein